MSGSELGSSSTSLDRDGEEAGLKEECSELQWCYPTLLSTSSLGEEERDGETPGGRERERKTLGEEERDGETPGGREREPGADESKGEIRTIIKAPSELTDIEGSATLDPPQSEEMHPGKRVTLGGTAPGKDSILRYV